MSIFEYDSSISSCVGLLPILQAWTHTRTRPSAMFKKNRISRYRKILPPRANLENDATKTWKTIIVAHAIVIRIAFYVPQSFSSLIFRPFYVYICSEQSSYRLVMPIAQTKKQSTLPMEITQPTWRRANTNEEMEIYRFPAFGISLDAPKTYLCELDFDIFISIDFPRTKFMVRTFRRDSNVLLVFVLYISLFCLH